MSLDRESLVTLFVQSARVVPGKVRGQRRLLTSLRKERHSLSRGLAVHLVFSADPRTRIQYCGSCCLEIVNFGVFYCCVPGDLRL